MKRIFYSLLVATVFATLKVYAQQFEDVTVSAGITNAPGYCLGAAWGDYDKDGRIDLYLAIGANTSRANALFRNNGYGTFTRIGAAAGPITTDVHDSEGCAWIDINNDGYRDMFVVNGGWAPSRNDFYWNNGDGTFRRGNLGELTELSRYRGWAACADWNGDGWVDIHVGEGTSIWGPYPNCVYQATGLDTFAPVDFAAPEGYVNAGIFGDYDNDGDADLFLSCYTSPSRLWRNDGGGNFTAMDNGLPTYGNTIHAAWGDSDRDGDVDIALSSSSSTLIYRNDGTNGFAPVTSLSESTGWPAWADYDNDGHLDLLVTGGQDSPRQAGLYRNNGDGTFSSVADVLTQTANNWLVCPWGDFDNDGFMDVIITHQYSQHRLYRNLGNTNHWIKFKLVGTASNRDAIGAKVRVQASIGGETVWQMQEVNGGYAMQNDSRLNFGLADATNVDLVRIEWPSGIVQTLTNVPPGQILTVEEHQAYGNQPPAFAGTATVTNGLQLTITEPAGGFVYTVDASTNLVDWVKVIARTSTGGTFAYTDTRTASYPRRFYRVVVP
jgi:hypothetical protein